MHNEQLGLIAALKQVGSRHDYAAIVVVTVNSAIAIPSQQPDGDRLLQDLVNRGDWPLGIMTMDKISNMIYTLTSLNPKFNGQAKELANRLLGLAVGKLAKQFESEGWRSTSAQVTITDEEAEAILIEGKPAGSKEGASLTQNQQ
jgi:hypothetical protein